jgi:hypothetical protein
MLDSIAFQSGFFIVLATSVFTLLHWILAALNGLRIERVGILYNSYIDIYKTSINSVEIILGWLPLGSYVKIAGILDESFDPNEKTEPKDFEFRGKPILTKFIIIMSSPLVLILVGAIVMNSVATLDLIYILGTYLQISFFLIPIESGETIWIQLYSNPPFLMGFIFFALGIANIPTNILSIFSGDSTNFLTYLQVFFLIIMFFLALILFRLTWMNFSLINLAYYFIGAFLTSIVSILLCCLIAKLLPNS